MGRPAGSYKRLTAPMRAAAMMVAGGVPINKVVKEAGVDEVTIRRWMQCDDMLELYREHLSKLAAERYAAAIFQSTLPVWGETYECEIEGEDLLVSIHSPHVGRDDRQRRHDHGTAISIHSPHVGRDPPSAALRAVDANFNPLSPHGERRFALPK